MAKILFEGIDIRDNEVTNGVIKKKKKEETLNLFDFNDIDYYLLENEIKLVRQLHKKEYSFMKKISWDKRLPEIRFRQCLF